MTHNMLPAILTVPTVIDAAPGHTHRVFDLATFPAVVDWVVATARRERFAALAACGHSGLLVAGAASYVLNVPIIAVRKPSDRARGDGRRINAVLPAGPLRYAFVDDMICSGATLKNVVDEVAKLDPEAVCAGIVLYMPHATDAELMAWWRNGVPDYLLSIPVFYHPPIT